MDYNTFFETHVIEYGETQSIDWSKLSDTERGNALRYFLTYGERQAGADVSAGWASLTGKKRDGTASDNAWSDAKREKIAKGLGMAWPCDLNELAERYFSQQEKDRLAKILNGTLTAEGRQPALDPLTREMFETYVIERKDKKYLKTLSEDKDKYRELFGNYATKFEAEISKERTRRTNAHAKMAATETDIGL